MEPLYTMDLFQLPHTLYHVFLYRQGDILRYIVN
jgi:hypothetical protein